MRRYKRTIQWGVHHMRTSIFSLLKCLAFLLLLVSCTGKGSEKSDGHTVPKNLQIPKEDLVSGEKEGKLYVMINIKSVAKSLLKLSEPEYKDVISGLVLKEVGGLFKEVKYKRLNEAHVDLINLNSLDEYGQPDFGQTQKLGSLTLKKDKLSGAEPKIAELKLQKLSDN
jgi:hypothetical protein